MGRQSDEALQLADADELVNYLMGAHCAYMQWRELTYYLTDANDIYWRAQDTNELNDKGHFPIAASWLLRCANSLTCRSWMRNTLFARYFPRLPSTAQ